jgi:hypothetical protein
MGFGYDSCAVARGADRCDATAAVVAFWRSGTDSADCVRERGQLDAGAGNGTRARDCNPRRTRGVGKEAHTATALRERCARCGGRCGGSGCGVCEPARFCGIAAGRYSAHSRRLAACQGHSVYHGRIGAGRSAVWADSFDQDGLIESSGDAACRESRIDRTRLAVRVVDGTRDGADWPFGRRDHCGRTCAA